MYRADQEVDGQFELYAVALDGSVVPRRLDPQTHLYGTDETFRLTPDSTRVVYRADQFDAESTSVLIGVRDHGREPSALFQAPLFAGTPRRVTPQLGDERQGCRGSFTSAGDGVVFLGDLAERNRLELFFTSFEPLPSAAAATRERY